MDKRNDKREELGKINVISIKVEKKSSILVDLSNSGFQLIIPFAPQKTEVKIEFEVKKKKFKFKGYIHWASRSLIKLNWYQIGVSVIEPPKDYSKIVKELLTVY